ncbi:MAG: AarF/ABC1/UbiB kinase family protein, partial [Pseudomonadota bacterium]
QGTPMPAHQLKALLNNEWGHGWRRKFKRFEPMPIAAASIGQVHRAMLKDGRQLAIKVQYPGVRESINSDVDNIRTLINLSGLLPKGVSLDQFLEEAKKQLHQEADYDAEGERLTAFREALSTYPDYLVPELVEDITTKSVLSMTYVGGDPVEMLSDADQATRDRVMTLLIRLLYKELFDFNLMQTDPNFANFRFDRATNKLVLLDFGATREIPNDLAAGYKKLMTAALTGDKDTLRETSISMGLITATLFEENEDLFFELFDLASEAFRYDTEYDFAGSNLSTRMRDAAVRVDIRRMMGHTPPIDTAFIHRKFGGIFLLGVRLKAKVNVRRLFEPYVQ